MGSQLALGWGHSRCSVVSGEGTDRCPGKDWSLHPPHSPPPAAAPTGCREQAGNQEGAGRCPQGPGSPWTAERLSLPALGSGPGGCGVWRCCCRPRQGRRRRWRRCRHSCGQTPRPPHPRLHSAPPEAPVGETSPGRETATPRSRAGKEGAGDVSREGGQGRGWGPGSCSAPFPLGGPWLLPYLDLLDQLFCPQQFRLQLLYFLLHGQHDLSKLLRVLMGLKEGGGLGSDRTPPECRPPRLSLGTLALLVPPKKAQSTPILGIRTEAVGAPGAAPGHMVGKGARVTTIFPLPTCSRHFPSPTSISFCFHRT